MSRRVRSEANLVIRVIGEHDTTVREAGGKVQVTVPGAVVTIADARAAHSVCSAWIQSENIARQAFTGSPVGHRFYKEPAQQVVSGVLLTGSQAQALAISGRAPEISPSGVGQVAVRLGSFTVVCDDRMAWESQHQAWCESYEVAGTIWRVRDPRTTAGEARVAADRWELIRRRK